MPVYKNNSLFNGAYYNGRPVNGKFFSDKTVFGHTTTIKVFYYNVNDNTLLNNPETDDGSYVAHIAPYHKIDVSLLDLPYYHSGITISGYTDQEVEANFKNLLSQNDLGAQYIEPIDHTLIIHYYLAPIKQYGIIHLNFIKGDYTTDKRDHIKTETLVGRIGSFPDIDSIMSFLQSPDWTVDYVLSPHLTFDYADHYIDIDLKPVSSSILVRYIDHDTKQLLGTRVANGTDGQSFNSSNYILDENLPNPDWSEADVVGTKPKKFTASPQVMNVSVQLPKSKVKIIYSDDYSTAPVYSLSVTKEAGDNFNLFYYQSHIPTGYTYESTDNPIFVFPNPNSDGYVQPTITIHVKLNDTGVLQPKNYATTEIQYVATYPYTQEQTIYDYKVTGVKGEALTDRFDFPAPQGYRFNVDGTSPVFTQFHQSLDLRTDTLNAAKNALISNQTIKIAIIPDYTAQVQKDGTAEFLNVAGTQQNSTPIPVMEQDTPQYDSDNIKDSDINNADSDSDITDDDIGANNDETDSDDDDSDYSDSDID